ncbi:MAG: hypothetical protein IJ188_06390 [Clostridia bacterium]|nr:hypothetical protein [Clostridia bacterium]
MTAYLDMPTARFYETWQAIAAYYERRAEAAKNAPTNRPSHRRGRRKH